MFYLYTIENFSTGKIYLGQSVRWRERLRTHKCLLRQNKHSNPHLQNAWNKYGETDFEMSVMAIYQTREEVDAAEVYYINLLNCLGFSYNIKEGGHVSSLSEETKEKIRQKAVGRKMSDEFKAKCRLINLGKKASEYTKIKMKQSHLGLKHNLSEEARQKQIQRNKDNKYGMGVARSDESKRNISLSLLGRKLSDTHKQNLIGRDCGANKYFAFGEEKTVVQWTLDSRCVVGRSALLARIKNKWNIELAITTPSRKKNYMDRKSVSLDTVAD